jgi:hypothetical protein
MKKLNQPTKKRQTNLFRLETTLVKVTEKNVKQKQNKKKLRTESKQALESTANSSKHTSSSQGGA